MNLFEFMSGSPFLTAFIVFMLVLGVCEIVDSFKDKENK